MTHRAPPPACFRRYRGIEWSIGRFAIAFVTSIALGAAAGVINAAGRASVGPASSYFLGDLVTVAILSGAGGVVTCLALFLVTTGKRAARGVGFVTGVTAASAFVLGVADASLDLFGLSLFLTLAACFLACMGWRAVHGSAAWIDLPGLCRRCGYDLTGLAAGACPECGTSREPSPWAEASL